MPNGASGFAPSCPPAYSYHMLKLRPFLTALLGLMLWVQGLAIAAAPIAVAGAAANAVEMPCHDSAASDGAPFDCCDSDCPDMAGCVIGHFAGIPAAAATVASAAQAAVAPRGWSPQTTILPLPLRPPITSHA